jgi:hypothetical protein
MYSQYSSLKQFSNINPDLNRPIGLCISDTLDRKFQYGGTMGSNSGPMNPTCQAYMAERCAKKWDGFCEYYYKQYGPNGQKWPVQQTWPNTVWRPWEAQYGISQNLTMGDQLLRNTAERKYCTLSGCRPVVKPLDPTDPNSPMVTTYDSYEGCIPTCKVNPSEIDNDPVMNRMLANPDIAPATLINICNTCKNKNIDLRGTKIGTLCSNYFSNLR